MVDPDYYTVMLNEIKYYRKRYDPENKLEKFSFTRSLVETNEKEIHIDETSRMLPVRQGRLKKALSFLFL